MVESGAAFIIGVESSFCSDPHPFLAVFENAVYAVVYALDLLAVNLGFLGVVIGFAMLAANLYMSFHLTEGFLYIEKTKLIDLGAADLREKWKLFCILMCASTVLVYVPLVNIIAIIANAVFSILFLVQFNKTKKSWYLARNVNSSVPFADDVFVCCH